MQEADQMVETQVTTPEQTQRSLILIVDDVPKNLQVLGTILRAEGFQIAIATSGKQALTILETISPDLILLDVMMPEMDGFQTCEKIKENSSSKNIPVIFLTAKTDSEDIVKGFRVGAADYVMKPFNSAELLARVSTHLELKHSRDLMLEYNRNLEELNATKDKFFQIISHDLKGPFMGFLGLSKLMSEDADQLSKEEISSFSGEIYATAERLFKLIENLLSWARIQTRQIVYRKEEFLLTQVAEHVIDIHLQNAEMKNISVVNNIPEDMLVNADINMVSTVLRNLISNAIKFTCEGGEVKISSAKNTEDVEIYIEDNGIGISQKDIEKLFKVGIHFTSVGTAQERGTGLGLLLCREMLDQHGGRITVESEVGKGTKFTVSLPQSQNS